MLNDEIISEINALKILLSDSDYKALKHADGALTDEEYEPIRQQRAEWRARVNELEAGMTNASETMDENVSDMPIYSWVSG